MNRRELGQYYQEVKAESAQKLAEAEQLKEEIDKLKQSSTDASTEIDGLLTKANETLVEITNKHTTLDSELTELDGLREQAEDPDEGLKATIEEINKSKKRADKLFEEISDLLDISKANIKEIEEYRANSNKIYTDLEKMREDSQITLKNIGEIYQLAADTGLAGSFDKRKQELYKYVNTWFRRMLKGILGLAVILTAFLFFTIKQDVDLGYAFSFRAVFLSPLIFFIAFCARQYSKERDLLEKYAFKATTALALESYTQLLSNRFDESEHTSRVLDFVLASMTTIYKEPYKDTALIKRSCKHAKAYARPKPKQKPTQR